ncbi:MAG: C4-type zinc ribbon domain-containing protein, partial [Myxococcota bacterium]|nr:C4-type zinc ribbon domain-containing protein [Myxococcota bacterium]
GDVCCRGDRLVAGRLAGGALFERRVAEGARDGEAMAVLEGNICQACYMEVMPNLMVRLVRGRDVVQCPSCDRILYRSGT